MIPIKFIRPSLPYLAGETAWFNELRANAYIKQGFAVLNKDAGEYVRAKTRVELMEEHEQAAASRKRAA